VLIEASVVRTLGQCSAGGSGAATQSRSTRASCMSIGAVLTDCPDGLQMDLRRDRERFKVPVSQPPESSNGSLNHQFPGLSPAVALAANEIDSRG
jgi:hypothetical protein